MRSGGCTVQQALTAEAGSIVKQAVVLAKRRGHAQVTPLHVANTMLSSSPGLLRTACLQSQSHSHPLQCKALELCFNVALNRLPTSSSSSSSSSPMMLGHHQHPSISNALVAAFKRAQAHQRRGSIENQQQPLLAVKIDLEQLIISILDDPSVSRVMREAGFSSTQVKTNVEQAVSLELSSQNNSSLNNSKPKENNNHVFLSNHQSGGLKASNKVTAPSFPVKDEDVMSVVESLMNKRRKAIVIVGECLGSLEGVIKGVMEKVDKEIKLISVPLSTFANIQREEVEQRIGELSCLVKSLVSKGVVLYLGDLKWITDYRANNNNSGGQGNNFSYCFSVEHMIMELGRLVCSIGENGKLWLVGIATFQTYMRCRTGNNSLESIWGLHPITIPASSLGLSLNSDSDTQLELRRKASENGSSGMIIDSKDQEKQILTCCADCSAKYEAQVLSLPSDTDSTLSSLPSWLKDEKQRLNNSHHNQSCVSIKELCKKWNTICNSSHKKTKTFERSLTFPSTSMITSFSLDQEYTNLHHCHHLPFLDPEQTWREKGSARLRIYIPESPDPRNVFSSNPNSTPNSSSSSDIMEMEYIPKFKEFNSENLNILSNALDEKVPWQKDIIREISGTILRCRSGMIKRKEKCSRNCETKEETWLFFQGHDVQAKEKIARELAKVVFGSYLNFVLFDLSSFSSTKTDSAKEYSRNKRSRDEQSNSYIERFAQGVSSNPHRVFFVEDVEQVDYCSQRRMKKAIERGKLTNSSGEEVSLSDAIIILSCESFSCRSRGVSPVKQKSTDGSDNEDKGGAMEESRSSPCISLDLNISIDDHESVEQSIDDVRLLESVDRCVIFRIQEL
nr:PREDICTED: protein SMAX1-LIKE 3-like [Nicotiana tabacum]